MLANLTCEKMKRSIETNYLPDNDTLRQGPGSQGQGQSLQSEQKQLIENTQKQSQMEERQDIQEEKQIANENMRRLPNLNTFTSAQMCNARNNVFQNDAANSFLHTNVNPLNTHNQQMYIDPRMRYPYPGNFPGNFPENSFQGNYRGNYRRR